MGERGAVCILLMICIIGGAFLLGGPLFSRSVSTILQLVLATITSIIIVIHYKISAKEEKVKTLLKYTLVSRQTMWLSPLRRSCQVNIALIVITTM